MEKTHNKEMVLWDKLRKEVENIDGIITYCAVSAENHNAVLSFNIEGWVAGDVGTILDVDYNIACRTGLQCAPLVHVQIGTDKMHGTVRLSLGPFNTEEHVDAAIEAVKEIAEMRK
jgi:selenocysteine lyase/cysteine desulfurase